jgi:hypothetical protein
VDLASFVTDYSGVAVPGSHGVPFSALGHLNMAIFLSLVPQSPERCQIHFLPT